MSIPLVSFRQVEKIRQQNAASFQLCIPTLDIYPGKFYAAVGSSGCGKSTLLDLLALVLQPSSAQNFFLTLASSKKPFAVTAKTSDDTLANFRKKYIGYVLQHGGLLPFLTVFENMRLTCQLNGMANDENLYRIAELLKISDQLKKKPAQLSGGQRQRCAIGRAIAHAPKLILADEPTASVDKETALEIRDELARLAHRIHSAVVMVTHDESLIRDVSDAKIQFHLSREVTDAGVRTISSVIVESAS